MRFPTVIKYTDVWISKAAAFVSPVWEFDENCVLPFPMPTANFIKLRHNDKDIYYYKLYAGFDIETTNYTANDKHMAFMYHWQFSIASDSSAMIFMGRTWAGFMHFMALIEEHYNFDESHRLIIADANLGFEFQFIRKKFMWNQEDFFAREERHPLKCRTGGFEFHEVLTISGYNLAHLAKTYTKTQKLVGDLDYNILRSSKTPLTPQEQDYCINDVVILAEFMKYLFDTYIIPDKRIPLTKTGLLRSECRQTLKDMLGNDGVIAYRQLIYECFPDEKTYDTWFRYLFRGGYVHANVLLTGIEIPKELNSVHPAESVDITSSYPGSMNLYDEYPLEKFKKVSWLSKYEHEYACILTVEFKNIRRKWAHSIESKSKAITLESSADYPVIIDNGRIAQAGTLRVMLTNVDLWIYRLFYDWDVMTVEECWISKKGRLPLFIRKTLNRHYRDKNSLKKSGKSDTPEYKIEKEKVNSFFGMLVTRIELDKVTYTDDWEVKEKSLDFSEEIKSQFLLPQWGIFVTALSRYSLLSVVAEITEAIGDGSGENGAGVIYNDTDSIKYFDPEGKVKPIIERYNQHIHELQQKAKLADPEFYDLGCYDFETNEKDGYYTRFKTLGSKRYLVEQNGKIKATIAGLPKQAMLHYDGDPFELFDLDGMLIDAEMSLKNGISYIDDECNAVIEGEEMHEDSCAGIFSMQFQMNLDKIYASLVVKAMQERIRKYGDTED